MTSLSLVFTLGLLVLVQQLDLAQGLTQQVRTQFVRSTNGIRSRLALGREQNKNGTRLPPGRNIYQLVYSNSLEAQAQRRANSCRFALPNNAKMTGNAIRMKGRKTINAALAASIVRSWYAPLARNGLQSLRLTARDNRVVRSYVRMAWGTAKEIGCGIKYCPNVDQTHAYCFYSPAQLAVRKFIYARGQAACKKNSDCTTYPGSTCRTRTGLCFAAATSTNTTTVKPMSTTPRPSAPVSGSTPASGSTPVSGATSGTGSTPVSGPTAAAGSTPVSGPTDGSGSSSSGGSTPVSGPTGASGSTPVSGPTSDAGSTPSAGSTPAQGSTPASSPTPVSGASV